MCMDIKLTLRLVGKIEGATSEKPAHSTSTKIKIVLEIKIYHKNE